MSQNTVSNYALSRNAVFKLALSKIGCPDVLCPKMICPKSVLSKKELPQIANLKNVQSKIDFAENAMSKTFPCQNVLSKKLVLDQICPIQKCPAIKERKNKRYVKNRCQNKGKHLYVSNVRLPFHSFQFFPKNSIIYPSLSYV